MIASAAVVPSQAHAQTPTPTLAPEPDPVPAVSSSQRPLQLDHLHQLGVSVLPGVGYRVIARYNENQTCLDSSGDDSKWVCTNDVPFFLDFQLSYGITRRLDLITDVRLGIAHDEAPGVGRQFALAPGIRVWLDSDTRLKFFTTLQGVFDYTEQAQFDETTKKDTVADSDFGVRNSNGLMYDAIRNVGFYLQFGETIGFARWFRIELDLGLGVQVRFP
jgi:hypothetical protein